MFTSNDTAITNSYPESGIGYKLNTDVLDWLTAGQNQERLKSMILPSTWIQNFLYHGDSPLERSDLARTIDSVQVGLINFGEILAGHSYTILTNNGTGVSSLTKVDDYWVMDYFNDGGFYDSWCISDYGEGDLMMPKYTLSIRPVINVNSSLPIISGNGTPNSPYIVDVI